MGNENQKSAKLANTTLPNEGMKGRYLKLEFEKDPPLLFSIEFRFNETFPAIAYKRGDPKYPLDWREVETSISLCFLKYVEWHLRRNDGQFLFGEDESENPFVKRLSGAIYQTTHHIHNLFYGENPKSRSNEPIVTHEVFPSVPGVAKSGKSTKKPFCIPVSASFLPPESVEIFWTEHGEKKLNKIEDVRRLSEKLRKHYFSNRQGRVERGLSKTVRHSDTDITNASKPLLAKSSSTDSPTIHVPDACIIPAAPGSNPDGWKDGAEYRQSDLYAKWWEWLNQFSLNQIIAHRRIFELQLRYNLQRSMKRMLLHQGWKSCGAFLARRKIKVQPMFGPDGMSSDNRRLKLQVRPDGPAAMKLWPGKEIHAIGSIRQIILEFPSQQEINAAEMVEALTGEVETAYRALEAAFIFKMEEASEAVFTGIYNCLKAGLMSTHGDDEGAKLIHQCWFTITDGKFCTYFFCGESLRATADRLKQPERQQPSKSPYDLLCSLVVHPFEFETTFSRVAIGIKKPLHFQLVRARYIQEAQAAYDAEVVLYSASDLTVNVCAECGDKTLTIACPKSIADEVIAESTRLKSALDSLLLKGFERWSPYISSVRLLANSTMPLQRQSL